MQEAIAGKLFVGGISWSTTTGIFYIMIKKCRVDAVLAPQSHFCLIIGNMVK